jgi:hypothetical protein
LNLLHTLYANETNRWRYVYNSGSQPGCRGTQVCREEVSGVPPDIEFTSF